MRGRLLSGRVIGRFGRGLSLGSGHSGLPVSRRCFVRKAIFQLLGAPKLDVVREIVNMPLQ